MLARASSFKQRNESEMRCSQFAAWINACRGARLAHCLGLSFTGTPYRSNRSPLFMLVLQELWGERTEERERKGKREEVNYRDRGTVPFLGTCQVEQGTVVLSGYSCHSRERERETERGRLFTPRSDLNPHGAELQRENSVVWRRLTGRAVSPH